MDRQLEDFPKVSSPAYVIDYHAERRPNKTAVIFEGKEYSYADMFNTSVAWASKLVAEGIKPAERVGMLSKNTVHFYHIYFACAKTRSVFTPLNWRLAPEEMKHILRDAEVKVFFVTSDYVHLVPEITAGLLDDQKIIVLDSDQHGYQSLDAWLKDAPEWANDIVPEKDDTFMQIYTSGTTGFPKGAELTHGGVLTQLRRAETGDVGHWSPADIALLGLPLFHVGGVCSGMYAVYSGGTSVVLKEGNADYLVQGLKDYPITKMFLVPTMIYFLLDHPTTETLDFSSLDIIYYGGAPIPVDLINRVSKTFQCGLIQMYAMTETTCLGTYLMPEEHHGDMSKINSCGKPGVGVSLKLVDLSGNEVKPLELGEILLKGDFVMKGYWKRPDETAAAIQDGWYHTGDIGYIDEDGYLYIKDRLKDMIISGGENIYPAEVENALCSHPAVSDAAVIGVPDKTWGEAVKAIVTLQKDASATPEEIIEYCRTKIARYKCPKIVLIVDTLPRNGSGKLLKTALRQEYCAPVDEHA